MSQINTNGINTNYPVPGQNNSTQGFRDNFTQIKTQLNTGATEITDLQNKVVVKAALDNTTINNDMANTLISNASTRGFRATTYNLGNALAGTVLVDVNRADVQYGAVTGNVTLQFGGWAPTNTESNVVLQFTITDPNYSISLPSSCVSSNNNYGVTLLENYANVASVATLTAPANTTIVEYTFSTLDCGNSVTVSPVNRPYQSTQIVTRAIPPTGLPGDTSGAVAVGDSVNQLYITSSNAADYFTLAAGNTAQLYTDLPVVFTGTSFEANITSGTTYYVRNVVSTGTFTVSTAIGGANVNLAGGSGNMYANPASYLYVCTDSFDSTAYSKTVANTYTSGNVIELNNTSSLVVNAPIIFSGNVDYANTNIVANKVYYIKTVSSPNVTVSQSRINGVAGTVSAIGTATGLSTVATVYVGSDIWKRVNLSNW
jgi:hypothetical protein